MSDTHTSGGAPEAGGDREGESRSGESWIERLMSAVGLKPSTATLREHLQDVLERGGTDDAFTTEERQMIRNILRLRETRVEDVMVPRSEIAAVPDGVSLTDLMIAFKDSGHSRMPVFRETLDDASGMVHIRDLMNHIAEEAAVRASLVETRAERPAAFELTRVDLSRTVAELGLVHPVLFVPASMPATDLLARMQTARIQMALVIDEYGGVDGLVSLEDIVETVVGEIEDEHDVDEAVQIVAAGDGAWLADGVVELAEVAAATGVDLDAADVPDDVETLGGLITSLLGRMPVIGEVVASDRLPGLAFEVLAADSRRIRRVRLTRRAAGGPAEAAAGVGEAGTA